MLLVEHKIINLSENQNLGQNLKLKKYIYIYKRKDWDICLCLCLSGRETALNCFFLCCIVFLLGCQYISWQIQYLCLTLLIASSVKVILYSRLTLWIEVYIVHVFYSKILYEARFLGASWNNFYLKNLVARQQIISIFIYKVERL